MADNDRQSNYAAVLEDIDRKIAELVQTAANIRALMGGDAGTVTGGSESAAALPSRREFKGSDPIALVKVGDFYGRSYAEAAREFLKRVGEPQSTLTILSAMRKAAYPMTGKNPASALYTSLKRHKAFLLVHRNTWGLAEWYPGVEKKKSESRPIKKTKGRRGRPPIKTRAKAEKGEMRLLQGPEHAQAK